MSVAYVITDANRGDASLVYSSWIQSYRHSPEGHQVASGVYEPWMRDVIKRILSAPEVRMFVARPPDWPEGIVGWMCCEPTCLHYAYVKSTYRKLGVGRALIEHAEHAFGGKLTAYSHKRPPWTAALDRRGMTYAPELARKKRQVR